MPKANISFLIYFLKKIHYYSFFKKCYKESLLNTFGILPNLFSKKKKIDDNHFLSLNISTKKKNSLPKFSLFYWKSVISRKLATNIIQISH